MHVTKIEREKWKEPSGTAFVPELKKQ